MKDEREGLHRATHSLSIHLFAASPSFRLAAQEIDSFHGHHRFIVPIDHLDEGPDDAPVGFRPRALGFHNRDSHGEFVARAHRSCPAQFVDARRTQACRRRAESVRQKASSSGTGRMPPAGYQAAVNGRFRGFRVHMKGLRIEASGEFNDLGLIHRNRTELVHATGFVVLKIALISRIIKPAITQYLTSSSFHHSGARQPWIPRGARFIEPPHFRSPGSVMEHLRALTRLFNYCPQSFHKQVQFLFALGLRGLDHERPVNDKREIYCRRMKAVVNQSLGHVQSRYFQGRL